MGQDRDFLHDAVETGNSQEVAFLLEAGLDVNQTDENGATPLANAVCLESTSVVEVLLDNGADIEIPREGISLYYPIHLATRYGNLQILELLVKYGANTSRVTDADYLAIHCAAETGYIDIIEYFLNMGVDVNVPTPRYHLTPLMVACRNGKEETVKYLFAREANINDKDDDSYTSLHYATLQGHQEVVRLLIRQGAKVNVKTRWGLTPLQLSARYGYRGILRLLLEAGATYNLQDKVNRFTLLHLAADNGGTQVVEYFLDKGASVDLKTSNGFTLLHAASRRGHHLLVNFLISKGANVNSKTLSKGSTPLHFACRYAYSAVVELLIQNNASFDKKDKKGNTPLDLIIQVLYSVLYDRLGTAKVFIKYMWLIKDLTHSKFSDYFSDVAEFKEELYSFWCECETEIRKMKKIIVNNTTISIYSFIKASFDDTDFVLCLYNENLIKGLKAIKNYIKTFEIYNNLVDMIDNKVKICMKRQRLLEKAFWNVNPTLPLEIKFKIFSYLDINDLNNVVEAVSEC